MKKILNVLLCSALMLSPVMAQEAFESVEQLIIEESTDISETDLENLLRGIIRSELQESEKNQSAAKVNELVEERVAEEMAKYKASEEDYIAALKEELQSKTEAQINEISAIYESRLSDEQQKVSLLEKELEEKKAESAKEIEAKEVAISNLEKELEAKKAEAEAEQQKVELQLALREAQLAAKEAQIAVKDTAITNLEEELAAKKAEAEQNQKLSEEEIAEKEAAIAELESELAEKKRQTEADRKQAEADKKAAEAEKKQFELQKKLADAELLEKTSAIAALQLELAETTAAAEAELEAAAEEIANLQEEMEVQIAATIAERERADALQAELNKKNAAEQAAKEKELMENPFAHVELMKVSGEYNHGDYIHVDAAEINYRGENHKGFKLRGYTGNTNLNPDWSTYWGMEINEESSSPALIKSFLKDQDNISFKVRGDGNKYLVGIKTTIGNRDDYFEIPFDTLPNEVMEFEYAFSELKNWENRTLNKGKITGVQFRYAGEDGGPRPPAYTNYQAVFFDVKTFKGGQVAERKRQLAEAERAEKRQNLFAFPEEFISYFNNEGTSGGSITNYAEEVTAEGKKYNALVLSGNTGVAQNEWNSWYKLATVNKVNAQAFISQGDTIKLKVLGDGNRYQIEFAVVNEKGDWLEVYRYSFATKKNKVTEITVPYKNFDLSDGKKLVDNLKKVTDVSISLDCFTYGSKPQKNKDFTIKVLEVSVYNK